MNSILKKFTKFNKNKIICRKFFVIPINFNEINTIIYSPNVLIVHQRNDISIDQYLEIKEEITPNKKIKYMLISIIVRGSYE